jgi:hypothetical protein
MVERFAFLICSQEVPRSYIGQKADESAFSESFPGKIVIMRVSTRNSGHNAHGRGGFLHNNMAEKYRYW